MIFKKILPLLILTAFSLVVGSNASGQTRKRRVTKSKPPTTYRIVGNAVPAAVTKTPEQERRHAAFVKVWQTIRDNYFDQTFGGLDWTKIWSEYEPRVAKTASDSELHELLQEMINRLNKSHFSIVPPEIYKAINDAKVIARARERQRRAERSGNAAAAGDAEEEDDLAYSPDIYAKYGIGIEMRLMNNQFVIIRVNEGSAAQKAGLRTGFVIEKVNGASLQDLLKKIDEKHARTKSVRKLLASEIVKWILNGEKETDVGVTYLNEKDEVKEVRIAREKLGVETVSIGRNYPEQYLNFETRSIDGETGYLRFDIFAMPIVEKFCSALTEFKDKKSLIVDLRGNHGGLFSALIGVTGMLSDRSVDIGTQIFQVGSEKISSNSRAKNFKGRIVFLVDETSISSAEIMAAAMQDGGRALIVGERTAGEALPAYSIELPTGAVFIYPVANFKTAKGNFIEGTGVTPDIPVSIDRKVLLEGRDPQMEAALKALKDDAAFAKLAPPRPTPLGDFNISGGPPPPAAGPPPPAAGPPPPAKIPVKFDSGRGSAEPPGPAPVRDEKSVAVIAEFLRQIGGAEAVEKIRSYSVKGVAEIRLRGMEAGAELTIFSERPGRYAEFMKTDALGEIREIFDKNGYIMQTDFGLTTELPISVPDTRDILSPILALADKNGFKTLKYEGIFDRQGRKAHLINAVRQTGETVALGFDVETKMLVGYAGADMTWSLGDYQKVQDLTLPFSIKKAGLMDVTIYEIKLNVPIDESNFKKKINCFDRPN